MTAQIPTFSGMRGLRRHPFLVIPWLFYGLTTSRTVGLPDSAVIHLAMRSVGGAGEADPWAPHAWNHPLTNLLGWICLRLLPGANDFWKVNAHSTICGATAIGLFYGVLVRLGATRRIASLASAAFMTSQSMWWHSVWVESYALNAVFFLACVHAVISATRAPAGARATAGLFLLCGLSLFNHIQNGALGLAAAGLLVWQTWRLRAEAARARGFTLILGAGLLGALPWLAAVLRQAGREGWQATFDVLTGGPYRALFGDYGGWAWLRDFAHLLFLQFPSGWVVAGLIALAWRGDPDPADRSDPTNQPCPARAVAAFTSAVVALHLAVYLGYRTWDRYAQLLQAFTGLALLAGMGFSALRTNRTRGMAQVFLLAAAVTPVLLYPRIPAWAREGDGYWADRFGKMAADYEGLFDMAGLMADPLAKDRGGVERLSESVLAANPAVVFADDSMFHQLELLRRLRGRAGIQLFSPSTPKEAVAAAVMDRPGADPAEPRLLLQVSDSTWMRPLEERLAALGLRRISHPLPGAPRVQAWIPAAEAP